MVQEEPFSGTQSGCFASKLDITVDNTFVITLAYRVLLR